MPGDGSNGCLVVWLVPKWAVLIGIWWSWTHFLNNTRSAYTILPPTKSFTAKHRQGKPYRIRHQWVYLWIHVNTGYRNIWMDLGSVSRVLGYKAICSKENSGMLKVNDMWFPSPRNLTQPTLDRSWSSSSPFTQFLKLPVDQLTQLLQCGFEISWRSWKQSLYLFRLIPIQD